MKKGFELGGEWTVRRVPTTENNQMLNQGFRAILAGHDPDIREPWNNFYIHGK